MADTSTHLRLTTCTGAISISAEDLQDLHQESRNFRKEVAAKFAKVRAEARDFRKKVAAEFVKTRDEAGDFRKEVAAEFADLRREMAQQWRNSLIAMASIDGIFATTTILIAFIRYQLSAG